jgi:hypothetical protein
MPKAILEFNLPEENEEFESAHKGILYKLVIWDLDMYLRDILKYNSDSYDEKVIIELQKTRDKIHELLSERDLNI